MVAVTFFKASSLLLPLTLSSSPAVSQSPGLAPVFTLTKCSKTPKRMAAFVFVHHRRIDDEKQSDFLSCNLRTLL